MTVLYQVYAKVIAGQEDALRERIGRALGLPSDHGRSTHGPQAVNDSRMQPDTTGQHKIGLSPRRVW